MKTSSFATAATVLLSLQLQSTVVLGKEENNNLRSFAVDSDEIVPSNGNVATRGLLKGTERKLNIFNTENNGINGNFQENAMIPTDKVGVGNGIGKGATKGKGQPFKSTSAPTSPPTGSRKLVLRDVYMLVIV